MRVALLCCIGGALAAGADARADGSGEVTDTPSAAPVASPPPDAIADAPPADRASGVEVAPPVEDHHVRRAVLAIPRAVALVLLAGPRYAAAGIDSYLDARSPNAFGRDTTSRWRFGATADWQTALGASLGARVGYAYAPDAQLDLRAGAFGPRGQSAGVTETFGVFTTAQLRPTITIDAGRELRGVFDGIGDARGPRTTFDDRRVTATAAVSVRVGELDLWIIPRLRADNGRATDAGAHPLGAAYAPAALVGFDEDARDVTGSLSVVYDSRHAAGPWIPTALPSSGTLVRASVAYLDGDADRTGQFATARVAVEARRLFDVFHGDRVISIGLRGETITADATAIPFDRLPALGGPDELRALAANELRDRSVACADVQYAWPLGGESRAYVFAELGDAASGPASWSSAHAIVAYGGGVQLLSGDATVLRLQLAGSSDGALGFYVQAGQL